jgi:sodium/potassium-transporting ATPase subunit alpha
MSSAMFASMNSSTSGSIGNGFASPRPQSPSISAASSTSANRPIAALSAVRETGAAGPAAAEQTNSPAANPITEHWMSIAELARLHPQSRIFASPQAPSGHGADSPPASDQLAYIGLTAQEAEARLSRFGLNRLSPPPRVSPLRLFIRQFQNFFAALLIVSGILSCVAYGIDTAVPVNLYLGIVLFVVVLGTGIMSFWQEYKTSSLMDMFVNMLPASATVIRDGVELTINPDQIVVGDIVRVVEGDKVPADLRLLSCTELRVECASITGESEPVACQPNQSEKQVRPHESPCLAFNGSYCIQGSCMGLVIRTGDETMIGNIAKLASQTVQPETTLQKEVRLFVRFIAILAFVMAAIFFSIGVGRRQGEDVLFMFVNGFLIVMIANVPQGLPATVTSLLTITARRLAAVNVYIKRLDAIESLGSTSIIASDKTGTITENKMTVTDTWCDNSFASTPLVRSVQEDRDRLSRRLMAANKGVLYSADPTVGAPISTWECLMGVAAVCNRARFVRAAPAPDHHHREMSEMSFSGASSAASSYNDLPSLANSANAASSSQTQIKREAQGNPSEIALLRCADELYQAEELRLHFPIVFEIPFSSSTKWHLVVCSTNTHASPTGLAGLLHHCLPSSSPSSPGSQRSPSEHAPATSFTLGDDEDIPDFVRSTHLSLMKGAPEMIVARCSHHLINGKICPTDAAFHADFESAYRRYGQSGRRVLGFAARPFHASEGTEFAVGNGTVPMTNMIFLGLIAIIDPPRAGVSEAITRCHTAGVRVFMVTGDHQLTAEAIAKQVGILDERAALVTPTENIFRGVGAHEHANASFEGLQNRMVASPSVGSNMLALQALEAIRLNESAQILDERIHAGVVSCNLLDQFEPRHWDLVCKRQGFVFARATPQQKLRIVEECQKRGHVVAVTGDGVNDSPALRRADVGIAMGINGSDVAREVADAVLMDDNFASIVKGIEQGRLIIDNMKKTIRYTLTHLMPEIIPVLLNLAIGLPAALSSLQILSIDLGTELGPAVSLAYEPAESDIMRRKPRNALTDRLVPKSLLIYSYLLAGVAITVGCFLSWMWVFLEHGLSLSDIVLTADYAWSETSDPLFVPSLNRTLSASEQVDIAWEASAAYYITLVMGQFTHVWLCKALRIPLLRHKFTANTLMFYGVLLEVAILLLCVYVPGIQQIVFSRSAGGLSWILWVPVGIVLVLLNEGPKYWKIHKRREQSKQRRSVRQTHPPSAASSVGMSDRQAASESLV